MLTYSVDVDFTDRSRTPEGGFVTITRPVTVLADTDTEAELVAAQLVAAVRHDLDGMVLATRITGCIA